MPGGAAWMALAATALALVWPSGTARADGAVMVVGNVSPHDREVIIDTVRIEGTALSLRFGSSAFSPDAADAAAACLRDKAPWSCVAPAIRGKDQLVIVEVDSDRSAGAPMTIVTAHLLSAGAETDSFSSRNCAMCNEDALKRAVSELSRDLLQRAAVRGGRTRLTVRSRPAGAQITLDGAPVDPAGPIATYPGKHTIVLQLPGYAPAATDVVAADRQITEVTITLVRLRAPAAERRRSSLMPSLAISVGCAAIAAGIVLIAINETPDPHGPQPRDYYSTATTGTLTLAAGALAAGAGLYFLLRPRASSTAIVAPTPGGAAIGWAGRF
ncbi:MAG: PEGA domain-containing protein [Deltaproteobacteria bacterium]|nr:MAG: PEGA domain-containing protein [Deltaproteobacteria bacterium]TMQ12810.1 MAG: PEGA domain-containing protein [Deltaproteobacteria bacterium]